MRNPTDAVLVALAALVNAEVAEMQAANAMREHRGEAPAYGYDWRAEHYDALALEVDIALANEALADRAEGGR